MTPQIRACAQCKGAFEATNPKSLYCSKRCAAKVHTAAYAARKAAQDSAPAAPPARRSPKPLPWVTPEVCAAVRLGIDTPSAQKAGRFVVVRDDCKGKQRLLVHVPTERLSFAKERIVVFVTLNPRRRWLIQPSTHPQTREAKS